MGPSTPQAKAVTSLNAITHGATSRKLFIPGEDPEDFFKLLEDFFAEYQPGTANACTMVTDLAHARWYLWRRQRSSDNAEFTLHTAKPDESTWTTEDLQRLHLFDRYKTEAERSFQRAFRNVQAVQKQTVREKQWEELFVLQKQRFELDAERFRLTQAQDSRKAEEELIESRNLAKRAEKIFERDMELSCAHSLCGRETYMGREVMTQHILVRTHDGVSETTFFPSNETLADNIAQVQTNPYIPVKPEVVARRYFFDGPVPQDYRWLLADPANDNPLNFKTVSVIPFEAWFAIAAKENALAKPQALNHLAHELQSKRGHSGLPAQMRQAS